MFCITQWKFRWSFFHTEKEGWAQYSEVCRLHWSLNPLLTSNKLPQFTESDAFDGGYNGRVTTMLEQRGVIDWASVIVLSCRFINLQRAADLSPKHFINQHIQHWSDGRGKKGENAAGNMFNLTLQLFKACFKFTKARFTDAQGATCWTII